MTDRPEIPEGTTEDSDSSPGPYAIEYTGESRKHLRSVKAFERSLVLDRVDEQLAHEPTRPTRNRKPLLPNPIGGWELRIGELRVLYDVDERSRVVVITAIGRKPGNRLFIEGNEVEL